MAAITFTLEELLGILKSNNLLPEQIVRSGVKDNCIELVVDTKMFMLPVVPVLLKYLSYENNLATFELSLGNPQFNKAMGMLGNSYQSKLPEYVKLALPNILIDIPTLLDHRKVKGLQVREITQTDNQFKVTLESKS